MPPTTLPGEGWLPIPSERRVLVRMRCSHRPPLQSPRDAGPRPGFARDARAHPSVRQPDADLPGGLVERVFVGALQLTLGGIVIGLVGALSRGERGAVMLMTAVVLLALTASALARHGYVLALLRRQPCGALLMPVPALLAVLADGGAGSVWVPLVVVTVGVSATVGCPSGVLGCATVAVAAYAGIAALDDAPPGERLDAVASQAIATIVVGAGVALLVSTLATSVEHERRAAIEPDQTPLAVNLQPAPDLAAPAARIGLSPAELRVVGRLAAGRAPKQIAAEYGLTLATIRTQLQTAKRKTHARTLNELVAVFIQADGQL